ncbi:unnamed protein product [Rotaria sp. Silwood2]|nr:unnamed protein product [Rotaria sp. Silwood2]CAF4230423.1 unnamed protein product [Rotaria sp. Silwood2]CAF4587160.1 unnamed protein product [Rotaria sp. Silwood2]
MITTSIDTTESLPLVLLLSQCLILLETLSEINENLGHALSTLQSLFKDCMLENCATVLLGEQRISRVYDNIQFKDFFKNIDDMISQKLLIHRPIDWEMLINTEHPENDLKLFASSISLAKVFQSQYLFHHSQQTRYINISSDESAFVHSAIVNIHDSILRIIALSFILEMKNLSIFNHEQEEQFRKKALFVIQHWLDYRTDKDWRFFRHFAALQLVIDGSNTPQLIDTINEMFTIDRDFRLQDIVKQSFTSQLINIAILRQILVKLHQSIDYSSKVSIWIECKEIFELILNLELERII